MSVPSPVQLLAQAVAIALDPTAAEKQPSLQAQANQYCQQVKGSPEGWRLCLQVVESTGSETNSPLIFFALQVIEQWLRYGAGELSKEDLSGIRSTMWKAFVMKETSPSPTFPSSMHPLYIRTKVALVLVLLFRLFYARGEWTSFFQDWINLLECKSPVLLDLFLRVGLVLDEEVVCLLINRSKEDTDLNTRIKDQMRIQDIPILLKTWHSILVQYMDVDTDIANACMKLFALYAPWTDASFFLQQEFVAILYQGLGKPHIRISTCECLNQMVLKGMAVEEKLRVLKFLNLVPVLTACESEAGDDEFVESLAKLSNSIGTETAFCFLSKTPTNLAGFKDESSAYLETAFPLLITYLNNESEDISTQVYPWLGQYLSVIKLKPPVDLQSRLDLLLNALALKLKYPVDLDPSDEEEEASILDSRKTLRAFLDAMFSIDPAFFSQSLYSKVIVTLNSVAGNAVGVDWTTAELAMYLLFLYMEIVRDPHRFKAEGDPKANEMFSKMLTCNLPARYPQQEAVVHSYFEAIVRQSQFFDNNPTFIPGVLNDFVGHFGLRHRSPPIRARINYLFLRFIKPIKHILASYVNDILVGVQDLLAISPPPDQKPKPNGQLATRETRNSFKDPVFDSQIYLLEAVGVLVSVIPPNDSLPVLTAIITPWLSKMEEIVKLKLYSGSEKTVYHLHHLIIAIGSVAKGYPDRSLRPASTSAVNSSAPSSASSIEAMSSGSSPASLAPGVSELFKRCLYSVSVVLEHLKDFECIRDSARFTFQRMVGCLGAEVLDVLQVLIRAGLLSSSTCRELVDFLPFLCLLNHTFKAALSPMFQEMYPHLYSRVMYFLELSASGTDELQEQIELKRAFLSFISSVLGSNLGSILISPDNIQYLERTLNHTILSCRDISDLSSQKQAFGILSKTVSLWGRPSATSDSTVQPSPLPGFDQFILTSIVPILFELPVQIGYSSSDKVAHLLLNELETAHRTIAIALGEQYLAYLDMSFLPSLKFPADKKSEFITALRTLDSKAFRKYLQSFIPWLQQHLRTH